MTEPELQKIFELRNAAIIAPAGHGKTEMIADIVEHSSKKQLLLTHTNAGVDALVKRLNKRKVPKEKYTVTTIAAFCIRWCMSYDKTGSFNKNLSPLNKSESRAYYSQLYSGTKSIFENMWAGKVLQATYGGVIVDEYQDCIYAQHEIFVNINRFLPVVVLGDPMQGIFSFAGKLVDWKTLPFTVVDIETRPWRWDKSNPKLGSYLNDIRSSLLPILEGKTCNLEIESCDGSVEIISPEDFDGYSLLPSWKQYKNIVLISQWPTQQLQMCSRMPGVFQYDEKQDCEELFKFATEFDSKNDTELLLSILIFVCKCVTGVASELPTYIKKLQRDDFDYSRIKKHTDFGELLLASKTEVKHNTILNILNWFNSNKQLFKPYRTELFLEMMRSVQYSKNNNITIFESANLLRRDNSLQKRYSEFKYLSSRTLLSKGLEFDCVVIDMTTPLSAKDFYVAMTRAMKKIYIISDTSNFTFKT